MLLEFLSGQSGGSAFLLDRDASPEMLRAKLIDAQMEIGRLQMLIDNANRNSAAKDAQEKASLPQPAESVAQAAFSDTVWAMRALFDRVNADGLVFEVDIERCEIRDLAAAPGRQVVVAGSRLRPFIEALHTLMEQER